uniref:hypothetical protein n=1 Tax=Adlercreutzia equolifaciens TaxID=446660 RepID=UPI0039F4C82C
MPTAGSRLLEFAQESGQYLIAACSGSLSGQSMPDISMLPLIAELYGVSIDELFGRSDDVTQDEADAIYLKALGLLGEDRASGLDYVDAQARQHWSCLPVVRLLAMAAFAQIAASDGFEARPLEGDAAALAETAERILRRVIDLGPQGAPSQIDVLPLARILQWTGRFDEARALVEHLAPAEPNLAALSLAQLHLEEGQQDAALETLQRQLLLSLVESMGTLAALAPICDDEQLEEISTLAGRMQASPEYVALFPALLPSVFYESAKRSAEQGDADETLDALTSLSEAVDRYCGVLLHPHNASLFDRIPDLVWEEPADSTAEEERAKAAAVIRQTYASKLADEGCWDGLRGEPAFKTVLAHIENKAAEELRHE